MRTIRPLHSLALIKLDKRVTKTASGLLHIPDIATRQEPMATVLAVGSGRWCPVRRPDGTIDPARPAYEWKGQALRPGDRVMVGMYNGKRVDEAARIDADGHELWLVETLPNVTGEWSPYAEADVYFREERADEAQQQGEAAE